MAEGIKWLGHASFKITKAGKVVYIDPYQIAESEPADLVLVTHEHFDHCSPGDVKKVCSDKTTIVATSDCAHKLKGNVKVVKPGDKLTIEGVEIEAVPAYNANKNFHPKANNWVGYIITLEGERIYHAGDTDYVPEMDNIKADIALLPVGGTYTMDAQEAAKCANAIKPKLAIPMHYGSVVGSASDAKKFKDLCQVEVEIL